MDGKRIQYCLKKICLAAVILACSLACMPVQAWATESPRVYVSVEKFTIGQGYLVEPRSMAIAEGGEKVSNIFERLMDEEGYEPLISGSSQYGWYLEGIKNADSGNGHVPQCISAMASDAPVTSDLNPASEKNIVYPDLSEFSYTTYSGWCYYVNNAAPTVSMGDYTAKGGDVIRFRFTLFGTGADLGGKWEEVEIPALKLPDLDALTKQMALFNDVRKGIDGEGGYGNAWKSAVEAIADMDKAEADIRNAVNKLPTETQAAELAETYKAGQMEADIQAVTAGIGAIGTVSLDRSTVIAEAREQYDALAPLAKENMSGETRKALWDAEARLVELKAIRDVEEQIRAIGTAVTLDSEDRITAARKAYRALAENARKEVSAVLLEELSKAENRLADLKKVQAVEEQIRAIGTVTKDSGQTVADARKEYLKLTAALKKEVSPDALMLLEVAEMAVEEWKKAQAIEEQIEAIGTVILEKESQITAARRAYGALTESAREKVSAAALKRLQDAETRLAELKGSQNTGNAEEPGNQTQPQAPQEPQAPGGDTGIPSVTPKDIAKMSFGKIGDQAYTGKAVKPVITVKDGKQTLKKGSDYTVSYQNNKKPGTAKAVIKGQGSYTGSKTLTFSIKKSLSKAKVAKIKNQKYTGKSVKPKVKITYSGKTLKAGRDYTVSYKNNKKKGKATVTIKGKGSYTGTKKVTFKIVKK